MGYYSVNERESEGYNVIMAEVRIDVDPTDPWGSNVTWLFALADYMWAVNGVLLPGYRPSPMGVDLRNPGYELGTLFDLRGEFEDADVRRVYTILSRRDSILKTLGKNY